MAYAFDRARLKYGYKLLRGADFDKKGAVDDNLRIQRFNTLREKLPDVLDVHSWHEYIKAIMNEGYLSGDLILSGNDLYSFNDYEDHKKPVKALKGKNPTRKTNLAGFSFEAAGGKSAANTPFLPKK